MLKKSTFQIHTTWFWYWQGVWFWVFIILTTLLRSLIDRQSNLKGIILLNYCLLFGLLFHRWKNLNHRWSEFRKNRRGLRWVDEWVEFLFHCWDQFQTDRALQMFHWNYQLPFGDLCLEFDLVLLSHWCQILFHFQRTLRFLLVPRTALDWEKHKGTDLESWSKGTPIMQATLRPEVNLETGFIKLKQDIVSNTEFQQYLPCCS